MDKICRRKFLEKSLLLNGSMILGSTWLSPFLDEIFLPSAVDYYLPIQADNPSIVRNEKNVRDVAIVLLPVQISRKYLAHILRARLIMSV
jgi:hypothetical protein